MTQSPTASTRPLSPELDSVLAAAAQRISRDRLAERLRTIVDIPSPTGDELPLARHLVAELEAIGCRSTLQVIDDRQGNATGRLAGVGGGVDLLLYAPTDTAFSGNVDEDEPWLGPRPRPDLALPARIEGGKVIGLGAENPKSYVACILEVVEAFVGAGALLPGSLMAGFAGGGMPISGRPGTRRNVGHGSGCAYMIERGVRPDYAVVVKPGYAVSWEEVGLTWHTLTIRGGLNYTGIRHRVPYRNPIVAAARVIDALEAWFVDYAARHTEGYVGPQGSIGAIRAGGADLSAFVPPTCQLYLDVRLGPRQTSREVQEELNALLEELRPQLVDFGLESEMTVAVEGTATPEDSWIVRSLVRAWEAREGRPHEAARGTSGATDVAILRGHGIHTARLGPPQPRTPSPYPGFSMGVADLEALESLAHVLLHAVVDTLGRTREEITASPVA